MKIRYYHPFLLSFIFFILFIQSITSFSQVLLGDDQITQKPLLKLIQGKRVGLLANMASLNSKGQHAINALTQNKNIHLVALFTPEHGLQEKANSLVTNSFYKKANLPVYSLYGKHRSPTAAEMGKIDIILVDLQSVGVRYYTFISTLALVMEAAKKYHKEVIVLDRPNPLGGNVVYGPVPPKKLTHFFTSYYPIPMRYGLTIGELARYYNKYFHIHAKLIVIPLKHWHRNMLFPQTGLTWAAPSPGLRTFKQAFIYSIFGPLESMGFYVSRRDHEIYFDRDFGTSWMTKQQATVLAMKLQQLKLPGLTFKEATWILQAGLEKGKKVNGFQVNVINYHQVKGYYTLLATLKIMYQIFGKQLQLQPDNLMIGSPYIIKGIKNGLSLKKLMAYNHKRNEQFIQNAKTILLYH